MDTDAGQGPPVTTPVTGAVYRDVIGRFATGVTIVTAHDREGDHGMTASAVSSLSLDPPMLLVCINRESRTGDAVRHSGRFTVNVLAEGQADLARRFATPVADRFDGVATDRGPLGTLVLDGSLARIDCRLDGDVAVATHRIFLGRVVDAAGRDGPPLAYFRGQFGQLHLAGADAVTAALRERVLDPTTAVGDPLDPAELAGKLAADPARIERALSALRREGLVSGDPVRGYRAAPVEGQAVDEALVARGAIELGAAELSVGSTEPADVAELRRLAQRTVAALAGGGTPDVEEYAETNTGFHETLVRLAGSPTLLDAYRQLSLPGILIRGVTDPRQLGIEHAEDHVAIADAWGAGDLPAVRDAIRRHTERTRATHASGARDRR